MRLLDRSPHGIEPTMYGRALLDCGTAVFDDLRQGVKQLEFLRDPSAGELVIGCTERAASGFGATVIEQFSRRYPRATLRVITADQLPLRDRELRQRTVELAIAATDGLPPDPEVATEVLFNDRQVVVAGLHSKWARRGKVALKDLMDEPWILPPPESILGRYISAAFRAARVEPPRAHIVSFSLPLCHQLLASGEFISLLPLSMARFGKHLPIKVVRLASPKLSRPVGILTLRNRMLSPLAELFIGCAREIAKPLAKRS